MKKYTITIEIVAKWENLPPDAKKMIVATISPGFQPRTMSELLGFKVSDSQLNKINWIQRKLKKSGSVKNYKKKLVASQYSISNR